MMQHLTETRAADREEMAAQLTALAKFTGATVEREAAFGPRQIRLKISVSGGVDLLVDFDGESVQPDVHVATWNVALESLYAFAPGFGDVNPHHFQKATRVAHGFADLCAQVRRDLDMLAEGRAYCPERALNIATNRRARLQSGIEYLAPLVAAGKGTTWSDGQEHESPEEVRARFERLPTLIAQLDSFIAAGCPREQCNGFPWR